MKKTFTRREVLGLGIGAAILGGCSHAVPVSTPKVEAEPAPVWKFPWDYRTLDIKTTQERAYNAHFKSGCMYGVFEAIVGQVAEKLGKPYTDFPFQLSSYGGGGVAGWGTLCGACNGAAMAISMFFQDKTRNAIINEIFTWYETTALPIFIPGKPVKVAVDYKMPTSTANSTLCHLSINRWVNASKLEAFSPERGERCARLVSDTAGFAADLLNKNAEKAFIPTKEMSDKAKNCLSCHGQGKKAVDEPEVAGKMFCTACHPYTHR